MRIFVIILSLFAFSCQQKENDKIIPANMTDTITTREEKEEATNKQVGDTIRLTIKDENGNYSAEGEIDSLHPRIYVKFVNDDSGKLTAKVHPAAQGNIRFNQIIFPDKTSDGPFGVDLEHELTQTGEHTLIIGHSLMAENPYQGKFKMTLRLE
jgi:hypothetical protein